MSNQVELTELVSRAAWTGIGIYSARIEPISGGYHFLVVLDGLEDPAGAVGVVDCDRFSRSLSEIIDSVLDGSSEERAMLPEDLTPENYTMEVSSAGVERELHLPGDLERFRERPMRIKYRKGEVNEVALVLYTGEKSVEGEPDRYCFKIYEPRRGQKGKGHARKGRKSGDSGAMGDGADRICFEKGDLIKVNLYLDF